MMEVAPLEKTEAAILGFSGEIWGNDTFLVWMEKHNKQFDGRDVIRIYIRRRDNKPISPDWRWRQAIKNQLVGPEYEAVELCPAESRLHNQTNIYDLWVVNDPNYRFSFGLNGRAEGFEGDEKILSH